MKYLFVFTIFLFTAHLCLGAPQEPTGSETPEPHRRKTPEECGPVILILLPVCGTDGRSYASDDSLRAYNCVEGLEGTADEVKVEHKGECHKGDKYY